MLATTATPLLEIHGVGQRYRWAAGEEGIAILDNVNMSLNEGEIVGLLGRSG